MQHTRLFNSGVLSQRPHLVRATGSLACMGQMLANFWEIVPLCSLFLPYFKYSGVTVACDCRIPHDVVFFLLYRISYISTANKKLQQK